MVWGTKGSGVGESVFGSPKGYGHIAYGGDVLDGCRRSKGDVLAKGRTRIDGAAWRVQRNLKRMSACDRAACLSCSRTAIFVIIISQKDIDKIWKYDKIDVCV